jgi:putative acetyltransferase
MDDTDERFSIEKVDPLCPNAMQLLHAFRAEMMARYWDLIGPSGPPPPEPELGPRSVCLLVTFDALPVACGAIRELENSVAEIKRVYVVPQFRRRGLARWLLAELERHAVESHIQLLRLETGRRQPEALALYEVCGYAQIAPYGRHVGDPMSVCFEKVLIR